MYVGGGSNFLAEEGVNLLDCLKDWRLMGHKIVGRGIYQSDFQNQGLGIPLNHIEFNTL